MKDLSIVIVTYNSQSVISECLESIIEQTAVDYKILVVDNASQDDTCRQVEKRFPQVCLMRNKENLGFATACNMAIERSEGRHVVLLNPDAQVLDGALDKMVAFLDEHPRYGMVGPKLIRPDGSIQMSGSRRFLGSWWDISKRQIGGRFGFSLDRHHLMKDWDRLTSREVEALNGACMMVRREAIEAAGMLDPHFFLMLEDIEWCRRVWEIGWPAYYYAEAEVLHRLGHATKSVSHKVFVESCIGSHYYLKTYYGSVQAEIYRILMRPFGTLCLLIDGGKDWIRGNPPAWSERLESVKLIISWQSPFRKTKNKVDGLGNHSNMVS